MLCYVIMLRYIGLVRRVVRCENPASIHFNKYSKWIVPGISSMSSDNVSKQVSMMKHPLQSQSTQALYTLHVCLSPSVEWCYCPRALSKIRPKITLYALSTLYETLLIISGNWKIDIFRVSLDHLDHLYETQLLNFGLLNHISLISALRGLETSPNIFK